MDELASCSDTGLVADKRRMICSGSLLRLLGEKGLVAVERLMGMVLVTLSVQMLLDGFSDYLLKLMESS